MINLLNYGITAKLNYSEPEVLELISLNVFRN